MSARAILNKLNALSDTVQDVKMSLRDNDVRVQDVEKRLDLIENEMGVLKEHLIVAIKRINDARQWVDAFIDEDKRDWRCNEEFGFATNLVLL